jgi:hypothetical protein
MEDIAVYAPEDRVYFKALVRCLPGVQGVQIDQGQALATIMTIPVHRLILLMSIDLLYCLLCEHEALYERLRPLERENILLVVVVRPCAWEESFTTAQAIPAAEAASLAAMHPEERDAIYKEVAKGDNAMQSEREAAYRQGYSQATDETGRLVLQLVELGYKAREIRRLLAVYDDHFLAPWKAGDLDTGEAAPRSTLRNARPYYSRQRAMTGLCDGCSRITKAARPAACDAPAEVTRRSSTRTAERRTTDQGRARVGRRVPGTRRGGREPPGYQASPEAG